MGKLTSRVEQSDTPNVVRIKGQRSSLCERWLISEALERHPVGNNLRARARLLALSRRVEDVKPGGQSGVPGPDRLVRVGASPSDMKLVGLAKELLELGW